MWNNQNPQKMSNLQTYYHYFKLDFQEMEQHTEGKRFLHGTKRHKHSQLQSLEPLCRIS